MGAFKLGKMTFGSLFKKPETTLYPLETKPQPEGLKGHIVVDVDQCILCGMCEKNCTTNCITVDKKEHYWEINPYGCIQCGYCTTICPKKCLHMDPNYTPAATGKDAKRFDVPVREKAQKASAEKPTSNAKAEALSETPQVKRPQEEAPALTAPAHDDAQLYAMLSLMTAEKAKIVEEALASK